MKNVKWILALCSMLFVMSISADQLIESTKSYTTTYVLGGGKSESDTSIITKKSPRCVYSMDVSSTIDRPLPILFEQNEFSHITVEARGYYSGDYSNGTPEIYVGNEYFSFNAGLQINLQGENSGWINFYDEVNGNSFTHSEVGTKTFVTPIDEKLIATTYVSSQLNFLMCGEEVPMSVRASVSALGVFKITYEFNQMQSTPNSFYNDDKEMALFLMNAARAAATFSGSVSTAAEWANDRAVSIFGYVISNAIGLAAEELCEQTGETFYCNFDVVEMMVSIAQSDMKNFTPLGRTAWATGLAAIENNDLANSLELIVNDPPDMEFTELEEMSFTPFVFPNINNTDADNYTWFVNYINTLRKSSAELFVALKSLEKYQGAALSNDDVWALAQYQQYQQALMNYNELVPELRAGYDAMRTNFASEFVLAQNASLGENEVIEYQNNVITEINSDYFDSILREQIQELEARESLKNIAANYASFYLTSFIKLSITEPISIYEEFESNRIEGVPLQNNDSGGEQGGSNTESPLPETITEDNESNAASVSLISLIAVFLLILFRRLQTTY